MIIPGKGYSMLHRGKLGPASLSLIIGLISGVIISLLFSAGNPWIGVSGTSLLIGLSCYVLIKTWHWAGGGKTLAWMIFLAFSIRILIGLGASLILPVAGYEEEVQNAGYLFFDAYTRDQQAWHFAESGRSLLLSFQNEFWTDQYGGLMGLSAVLYRFLSPDTHRPHLIIILGVFAFSLGIPFFWKAVQFRWTEKIASLAAWILIFYPDSILFSSSQMREPFLIGLFCIAFWGAVHWGTKRKQAVLALAISLCLMGLISLLVMAAVSSALFLWLWLEDFSTKLNQRLVLAGWLAIFLVLFATIILGNAWFEDTARWDLLLTERSSGWVAKSIGEIGGQARIPFMVGYGLVQPLLPAALADDAIAIWKSIGIFRSLGWFMLIPFLITPLFILFKLEPGKNSYILLTFIVSAWILISSIRAGGDQWDNPRYRTIFIPWMALLVSWTFFLVRELKSPWLFRIFFVEIIFLAFFTNWYFSRYFLLWKRLPFWENIIWVIGLTSIVIIGGLLWDFYRQKAINYHRDQE